jgi:hypothetical protein
MKRTLRVRQSERRHRPRSSLVQLTEESIQEHVEKARHKIANGDPAGAIANAYTLVEEFLKQFLRKTGTAFNESEGDIRALYKASPFLCISSRRASRWRTT